MKGLLAEFSPNCEDGGKRTETRNTGHAEQLKASLRPAGWCHGDLSQQQELSWVPSRGIAASVVACLRGFPQWGT